MLNDGTWTAERKGFWEGLGRSGYDLATSSPAEVPSFIPSSEAYGAQFKLNGFVVLYLVRFESRIRNTRAHSTALTGRRLRRSWHEQAAYRRQ